MAATDLFTLAYLAEQVALNVGATDNLTLAKCKKSINRALLRFSEMGQWSWQKVSGASFPTVIGTEEYTLSAIEITSMFISSPIQRKIVLLEDRKFRSLYPNNTATGSPYHYRLTSAGATADTIKVGLYPLPDAVYTIKYDAIRAISLLSADADDVRVVTGMPSKLIDLLIEMATAIEWKRIDDTQASAQMSECVERLAAAYADDQSKIDDRMVMAPLESDDIDRYFDPQLDPRFNE